MTLQEAYERTYTIDRFDNRLGMAALSIAGGVALAPVAEAGYLWAMTHPVETMVGIEILDGYYGGSSPGYNLGSFTAGFENFTGTNIVPDWLKP
jgi:hypothetical protein